MMMMMMMVMMMVLAVVVGVVIKSCKLSTNLLYFYPSEGKIMIWTLK